LSPKSGKSDAAVVLIFQEEEGTAFPLNHPDCEEIIALWYWKLWKEHMLYKPLSFLSRRVYLFLDIVQAAQRFFAYDLTFAGKMLAWTGVPGTDPENGRSPGDGKAAMLHTGVADREGQKKFR